MKKILYFWLILLITLNANDFTDFSNNSDDSMLKSQSDTQAQTSINLQPKVSKTDSNKTQTQISLLREANVKRNGVYVMLTIGMIPLERQVSASSSIRGLSFGGGIRSGVISYLDEYIGIRGYFAFDFTNDSLSPFTRQREEQNGTFIMLSLGMDILIDFFIDKNYRHTLGFFMGIGAGGLMYFDGQKGLFVNGSYKNAPNVLLTGNVMVQGGLSAVINYKNRIELGVRFLPTQSFLLNEDGITADYNFYVGYSYKF